MARPVSIHKSITVSLRMKEDDFNHVKEIAEIEKYNTGRNITTHELLRQAINYVYTDNERMRECFRRSREMSSRAYKSKVPHGRRNPL